VTALDVDQHLAALRDAGELLAAAVGRIEPDAPVPSCPDWTVRDLARHTGGVHRWATLHVVEARTGPVDTDLDELVGGWPDDVELAGWLRDGVAALADALATAPADLQAFAFLPAPSPRAFWARRQAHETTVHRVDAQQAVGAVTPIDPALAADGLDELLFGFAARPGWLHDDATQVAHLHAPDVDCDWTIRVGPDGAAERGERGRADCRVVAPAADLYLLLWNRCSIDGLDVEGDATLLAEWPERVRVRWS